MRWLRRVLLLLLVVVVAWLVVGYFLVLRPATNRPRQVDAVIVLGPSGVADAINTGADLVKQGYARNLVVSTEVEGGGTPVCHNGIRGARVICFRAQPLSTQGEARRIEMLASSHRWKSLIVVTARYHVGRSKLLIDRCFHGEVLMVAADGHISTGRWIHEFLYESAAWVKTVFVRSC